MRGLRSSSSVLLLLSLLAGLACAPSPLNIDATPLTGDSITLRALRAYKPSYWQDGTVSLDAPAAFTIPAFVPVVLGNGGNHWVELQFRTPEGVELRCDYQAGSDVAHPQTAVQIAMAQRYLLRRCSKELRAGDRLQATWFRLHIRNGDDKDPAQVTEVELHLGGTVQELEPPLSASETVAIRDAFSWQRTTALPELNTEGAPALFYTLVYIEDPEQVEWLDELRVHHGPLPLFREELARWDGQRGMFSHEGDGHGVFLFALMPATTYNLLRAAALEDPDLIAYKVIARRDVPAAARLPDGSVSYAALRTAGFMYRGLQPGDTVGWSAPGAPSPQFLNKLRQRIRAIATAVTAVVRTVVQVIGVIDRFVNGSVELEVHLEMMNTDPAFNAAGATATRMVRPWGSHAGDHVQLPGVRVDILQTNGLMPELFTAWADGNSTIKKKIIKERAGAICLRVENDAAYVTKLLLGVQVCDFAFSGSQSNVLVTQPIQHGYFNLLAQASEGRAYLRDVASHSPRKASILVGRLADLVGRYVDDVAVTPCLGFRNIAYDAIVGVMARTAVAACSATLGAIPGTQPLVPTVCPAIGVAIMLGGALYAVDMIVPDDPSNLTSRGVASHEYGHFAFCSLLQAADPNNLSYITPDLIRERMTRDPAPDAETAYINEAVADFMAGQLVGGVNYFSPAMSRWTPGMSYCPATSSVCLDGNGNGSSRFDWQIERVATLLHDAFDGWPSNPPADVPGNGGYWAWSTWSSPIVLASSPGGDRMDEQVVLTGGALRMLAAHLDLDGQGLTQGSFFRALNKTAESEGFGWCQRCELFALHDARFPATPATTLCQQPPISDWIGPGSPAGGTRTFRPGPEGKDAVVWSHPDRRHSNDGDRPYLDALAWTWSGVPGVMRSLVEIDLTSIAPGTSIVEARLELFANPNGSPSGHSDLSGSNAWLLSRIAGSWDEHTVTWNSQPPIDSTQQILLQRSTSNLQAYSIDVTGMVQDMVDHPAGNHGFMLQLQTEQHYRAIRFGTSDADLSLRPRLVVTLQGC